MYRILIVEDDPVIAGAIADRISQWNMEPAIVRDFRRVLEEFNAFSPHLVIMDLLLPFFDGYHWCREIRKVAKTPVVFLSSAAEDMNIIMAMNMGGDDFIAKPIDLSVLIAKLQAVLRRCYEISEAPPMLAHRGASLNQNDLTLSFEGRRIELTRNEYRILEMLMEHAGSVVSREALMTRLWEMDAYVEENTLTVNVNRLRRKLEEAGLVQFITTKVGSGYIIE
ncbi:MAG: response regulator transcription factor [Clostridia bacterium]|nr:response regulator transcription factor [Clostridia bacterium]